MSGLGPSPLFDTYASFKAMIGGTSQIDLGAPNAGQVVDTASPAAFAAERPAIGEYIDSMPESVRAHSDHALVTSFLKSYSGLETTFRSYRSQVERLMLWAWLKAGKSVLDLTLIDAEAFMEFTISPDPEWIGKSVRNRFVKAGEIYEPNPAWRPFNVQASKESRKLVAEGLSKDTEPAFKREQGTIRQAMVICSSFYDFMAANNVQVANPFRAIKQKSKYITRNKKVRKGKALSKLQWDFVVETAELMADENPDVHERTLFILVTLFSMYLRVSDIVGNSRWTPTMGSFVRRGENWWYEVNGKGNKDADVTVRPDYLPYLVRYRTKARNLTPLPQPHETHPLLTKLNGEPGLSDRHVRALLQEVFDRALARMQQEGFGDVEVGELRQATLHWLRHTSATFDAPYRSRKHLQADLRHENASTTEDIYYNVDDQERAQSIAGLRIKPS